MYDCHQKVIEPQATVKYTHEYTGTVSQAWHKLHTSWSSTGCRLWRWHGQMMTVSQATKTNRTDRLPCSYIIALATE